MAQRRTSAFPRTDRHLAARARALGHPARLRILRLLAARGGCICTDIAKKLPLAQSTVSQHLKILREAGLIGGEIDGPRTCYRLEPVKINRLSEHFSDLFKSLHPRSVTTISEPCCASDGADVKEKYARIATQSTTCCGDGYSMIGRRYDQVDGYVPEADLRLGCGLPTEHAGLKKGQTVLDLGSGAGLDAFVARRIVGREGRVVGLDFTREMIERARANASSLGYDNVEFHEGDIVEIPLPDASVDVILSNCVLNLVKDKQKAFSEMYRVLVSGGHFCVSDVVCEGTLPADVLRSMEHYVGCIEGAMERTAYLKALATAGFRDVQIAAERQIDVPREVTNGAFDFDGAILSVTVTGWKS